MAVKSTQLKAPEGKGCLTPVRAPKRGSRDEGAPEVAFQKNSQVKAPQVLPAGNPFFNARFEMYGKDGSAKLMAAIEKARSGAEQTFGKKATELAEQALLEAIEFGATGHMFDDVNS